MEGNHETSSPRLVQGWKCDTTLVLTPNRPVKTQVWEGWVGMSDAKALVKSAPCAAMRSRFGVRPRGCPRHDSRSARRVSIETKMTFIPLPFVRSSARSPAHEREVGAGAQRGVPGEPRLESPWDERLRHEGPLPVVPQVVVRTVEVVQCPDVGKGTALARLEDALAVLGPDEVG